MLRWNRCVLRRTTTLWNAPRCEESRFWRRRVSPKTRASKSATSRSAVHAKQPCAVNSIGNESAPIQLAQCWFAGLAISNAEIWIYFSKKMRKQFHQTALGNCYGLKLPKCWLQFKKINLLCHLLLFWHTFVPYCWCIGVDVWECAGNGVTIYVGR